MQAKASGAEHQGQSPLQSLSFPAVGPPSQGGTLCLEELRAPPGPKTRVQKEGPRSRPAAFSRELSREKSGQDGCAGSLRVRRRRRRRRRRLRPASCRSWSPGAAVFLVRDEGTPPLPGDARVAGPRSPGEFMLRARVAAASLSARLRRRRRRRCGRSSGSARGEPSRSPPCAPRRRR